MSNLDFVDVDPIPKNIEQSREEQYNSLPIKSFGLTPTDYKLVEDAGKKIDNIGFGNVSEFGKDIGTKTASYTDDLLKHVQNKNLDELGEKLNQVVRVAQELNLDTMINKQKSSGLLGGILRKLKGAKASFNQEFDDTKTQIDRLITEVEASQSGLGQRNVMLEKMYLGVQDEYKELGVYIVAGKLKLNNLAIKIEALASANSDDPANSQKIYDLNHLANNLEKRVSDLIFLQQSALQTLPMIRIIQSNNSVIVEKFITIKSMTIPAWKNQISLAISLHDQKTAVKLANTIDDATNELLKKNADMLHLNSVDTAKANQRSIIDIETLEHVQNTLIKTVQDVIEIQKEGAIKRENAYIKLKELQSGLNAIVRDDSMMLSQKNI